MEEPSPAASVNQVMMQMHPPANEKTIPLSNLIEFVLQKTYHDINVLSELLPRKTDTERKIEIIGFANKTLMLFIRLLAIVKWASGATKVDKCAIISQFLEKQSFLFQATATDLSHLARNVLSRYPLPHFSLSSAIDVLNTGTYPRLPNTIRARIVPPAPIGAVALKETLHSLNRIIEYRLVTLDKGLPQGMRNLVIKDGKVKFTIANEFMLCMTLMSNKVGTRWRLLEIKILVEDPITGDGRNLIHPLQMEWLHGMCQQRLDFVDRPLPDIYNVLHTFVQSIQLQVFSVQSLSMIRKKLAHHFEFSEYILGERLTLSYWRNVLNRTREDCVQKYMISVHICEEDNDKPLKVTHTPEIIGDGALEVAKSIKSDCLSIERLVVQTIQIRCISKLKEVERQTLSIMSIPTSITKIPLCLYISVVPHCLPSEKLCISVDSRNGKFLASMNNKVTDVSNDIQDSLNKEVNCLGTRRALSKCRNYVLLERCKASARNLGLLYSDHVSFVNIIEEKDITGSSDVEKKSNYLKQHKLCRLNPSHIFIQINKKRDMFLIVEFGDVPDFSQIQTNYYYLDSTITSYSQMDSEKDGRTETNMAYLRAGEMERMDEELIRRANPARLNDDKPVAEQACYFLSNRKGQQQFLNSPSSVPILTHLLSLMVEREPLAELAKELSKRNIKHDGISIDKSGSAFIINITNNLPHNFLGVARTTKEPYVLELQRHLKCCSFYRSYSYKSMPVWVLKSVIRSLEMKTSEKIPQGKPWKFEQLVFEYPANNDYDKLLSCIQQDWLSVGRMLHLTGKFMRQYNESDFLKNNFVPKCFTFKRLKICYGPNKCYMMSIQYSISKDRYVISHSSAPYSAVNPSGNTSSSLINGECNGTVAFHLAQLLNKTTSVAMLCKTLYDTWSPLKSIYKLNTSPLTAITMIPNQNILGFTFIPINERYYQIIYRSFYVISIYCTTDDYVEVSDGAVSCIDNATLESFHAMQWLNQFLNVYQMKPNCSISKNNNANESSNAPATSSNTDTLNSLLTSSFNTSSGFQANSAMPSSGIRFNSQMTPSPSQPLTPASPAQRMVHSSPATFPLPSSPTSAGGVVPPSPSPSPSAQLVAPSPGVMPSPSMPSPQQDPSSILSMTSPSVWSPSVNQQIGPSSVAPGSVPTPAMSQGGPGSVPPSSCTSSTLDNKYTHSKVTLPELSLASYCKNSPTKSRLTYEVLNLLMTPIPAPPLSVGSPSVASIRYCPLERFLITIYLRHHIHRYVQEEEQMCILPSNDAGILLFKTKELKFKITLNSQTMQNLRLNTSPLPEVQSQWEAEELLYLDRYFEYKVVAPPFRLQHSSIFLKSILTLPRKTMKSVLQLMKMEMMPDTSLKWGLSLCLVIPAGSHIYNINTIGYQSFKVNNRHTFIMIKLTRTDAPPGVASLQHIAIPLIYDSQSNVTQVYPDSQRNPSTSPPQWMSAVVAILKRYAEMNTNSQVCSLFPAIHELLSHLVIT